MIEIKLKNKEVDIVLQLKTSLGEKPKIYIEGTADLIHHLIEGVFDITDKIAKTEGVGHEAKEWKGKINYKTEG
jgi:hypothetical protein